MKSSFIGQLARLGEVYEISSDPSRLVAMEGLRGLAVLLVFFVHFHALFGQNLPETSWLRYVSQFMGTVGNSGVDLFFVMSGYLIYGLLLKRKIAYFRFVKRRVRRIYPTFVIVLGLYLLLSFLFPEHSKMEGSIVAKTVYIIQNVLLLPGMLSIRPLITVSWSLSYEIFFYLTIPIVVSAFRLRQWPSRNRMITAMVFWAAVSILLLHGGATGRPRMISFVTGIALYEVILEGHVEIWMRKGMELAAVAGVLASFILFYAVHAPRSQSQVNKFLPYLFLSVAFFWLCLCSLGGHGVLRRVFCWNPLRYLGNMSYSYYLIHGLTLEGIAWALPLSHRTSAGGVVGLLLLGMCATWTTSTLLFLVIEKRYSLASRPAPQPGVESPLVDDTGLPSTREVLLSQ